MKTLLLISALLFSQLLLAQDEIPLVLEGTIGVYKIEMIISKRDYISGELEGKYRYEGKKNYLDLKGITYTSDFVVNESYNDVSTGTFYLTIDAASSEQITGYWVNEAKTWYDVKLEMKEGDQGLLSRKSLEEYSNEVSNDLSGTYGVEWNWVNDMWFTEDKPQLEIGYNGGYVVLEQINQDSLRFAAELICGPTYHFAIASGIAINQDSCFVYRNEDGCQIEIWPDTGKKALFIEANSSMDCEFGARAYMSNDLVKISDEVPPADYPEVDINKLLGRKP